MSAATHVKEITTCSGKKKYQAQVWHKGEFYTSKTFDLRALAVAFKEDALRKAVSGTLLPAADRRRVRVANSALGQPPAPLADNTVRLRLIALSRIIRFAKSQLPEDATFRLPALDELFEFTLPAAHTNPRTREPSDDEFRRLLLQLGADSELGHFLRAVDETGCRLGELLLAEGKDVRFFLIAGNVVGGSLALKRHKTSKKIGSREVPLSLFAAQLLHKRQQVRGRADRHAQDCRAIVTYK